MGLSEEQKVQYLEDENPDVIRVYNRVPYSLIRQEVEYGAEDVLNEIGEICKYYKIYKKGKSFGVEGSNGDYIPAELKYKLSASLINKEARFLFGERPNISIGPKGDLATITPDIKANLTVLNDLVKTVLDKNMFEDILLKGAKDCFIGKRVAALVNFNEEDGVTISFLPAMQFLYEYKQGTTNTLKKFVCFSIVRESMSNEYKRVFKKKFVLEDDGYVYLEEEMYDGAGRLVEEVTTKTKTKLTFIPAVIFINDGLTGETDGDSEIFELMEYEQWYSKLSNADSDAQRKSMNPTKYTVDMDNNSTKNLSTGAGAFWDLGSDQNLAEAHPQVGLLEPKMNYSEALKTTLDRVKTSAYELVDMPNITLDVLQGAITSGKALKAIYWPLIVRCKEKMKMWGPNLVLLVDIIIEGSIAYPKCILKYTDDVLVPVSYEVSVKQITPLPEDEIEEKTTNLAEVETQVMSKKSYMKRWYDLTDDEVNDELQQIALERQILEDSAYDLNTGYNGDNSPINAYMSDDFLQMGTNAIKPDGTDKMSGSKNNLEEPAETTGNVDDVNSSFTGGQMQSTQQGRVYRQTVKSLNGSQINSLMNILTNYRNGMFNRQQAISLIRALGLGDEFANALLDEEKEKANAEQSLLS